MTLKQPDTRRNEILDVAQQLFYTQGYEQTTIRDIIDAVGIAKGTFYHYFASKADLLDDLIARMLEESARLVEPILADPDLPAPLKLQRFFGDLLSWKTENRAFLLSILRVFYSDENAIFVRKLKEATAASMVPPMTAIIRQGVAEGAFATAYPEEVGAVILAIGQSMSEGMASMLLQAEAGDGLLDAVEHKMAVWQYAIERLLGVPTGSLPVVDYDQMRRWFG